MYTHQEFAKKKGGKCLSTEYIGYNELYLWEDRKGKQFYRKWVQILRYDDVLYAVSKSKPQIQLTDFIESLGFKIEKDVDTLLTPYEIDIYIPELKVGIEFHGLKWHSEASGRDKKYHLNKLNAANQKEITLIQIFEHEWRDKQSQVKSFLRSKLGKNEIRLSARNLQIKKVDSRTSIDFLDKYHIQGAGKATVSYGLYNKEELISLITIGPHHWGKDENVLTRYICKENYTVSGGLSRLVSAACKEFPELVTWVDLRWSDGKNWLKTGWGLLDRLSPDFFYYNINTKKVYTQHSNIDCSNPLITRIWDCGKLKLIYRKSIT